MQKKALSHKNLSVIYNTVVEEVLGTDKVTGVKLKNLKTGEATTRNIDGLFVAIGYIPNTSFLKGKLELDSHGYIITKDEVKTNIEGIFAAGDVSDRIYRQAVTAAGSGAKAALEVREYIHAMKA
jgi:thioredoxin reductase (NADPH)